MNYMTMSYNMGVILYNLILIGLPVVGIALYFAIGDKNE